MIDINRRWKGVADSEKWAARGASFLAKVKATKVVWFPPEPVETGKTAALTGKKSTKRVTKKTSGAAKKAAKGTKNVTDPVRRKKT